MGTKEVGVNSEKYHRSRPPPTTLRTYLLWSSGIRVTDRMSSTNFSPTRELLQTEGWYTILVGGPNFPFFTNIGN